MNPCWLPVLRTLVTEIQECQVVCRTDDEVQDLLGIAAPEFSAAVAAGRLEPILRGPRTRSRRFTSSALLDFLLLRVVYDTRIGDLERYVAELEADNDRLRRIRPSSRVTRRTRADVLARDGRQCRYCGKTIGPRARLHLDHVVPVCRDGSDDADNLVVACEPCNMKKGSRLLAQTRMTLRPAANP